MKIGIDLDGTIADNLELLVEAMNRFCGKNLRGEEIYQYNLCKVYNISEAEFVKLMNEEEQKIISKSPLIPYARESIQDLVKQGWEVHIITARNPRYQKITESWLQDHNIPYKQLHLLNSHDKLAVCQQLRVKLMIEDNIHNAYQLHEGGVQVILFEAHHNRYWPWQGLRCTSWQDVYQTINKMF
ncbi:hypothetical protein JCM14036_08790 [Desulfotomaculum defluvii]